MAIICHEGLCVDLKHLTRHLRLPGPVYLPELPQLADNLPWTGRIDNPKEIAMRKKAARHAYFWAKKNPTF